MENSSPPSYKEVMEQYPTAPAPDSQPVKYNQSMQHNQQMQLNQPAQLNQMPSYGFVQPHQMPQFPSEQQSEQTGGQINFPLQQPAGPNTILMAPAPTTYGPHSQSVVCPSCGKRIETKLTSDYMYMSHVVALVLCIMGCCLCSCIPYFMDSCKNQNHYCPQCNAYLGTHTFAPKHPWDSWDNF